MHAHNTDIISRLKKDILALQGFKPGLPGNALNVGLEPVEAAFPNGTFPLGAVHEFLCAGATDEAATGGFIAGVLSSLMKNGGACIWISSSRTLFPPALRSFGIEPDRIVFVDLKKENDVLWAMEEALKCGGLAAVVGEMQEIGFTASRRLQLAVEQSRVTGFLLRRYPRNCNITACVTRWKIRSVPSELENDMPGVGFPRWKVELLKVRNGRPGTWEIEWADGRFWHIAGKVSSMPLEQKKKTG